MKPTQSPSTRQIFIYDISAQRFGIFSLFLGIPSLGLLIYGLLSKAFNFAWIGLGCLLVSLWLIARLIWRIRFFQKVYENGETVETTLNFVSTSGDEINVSGEYIYKKKNYGFSTTLQKTRRTKELAVGDQIWLVVDQDNPENIYVQDLFTSDSPHEIRQHYLSDNAKKEEQDIVSENDTYRIKVSGQVTDSRYSSQFPARTESITETHARQLTIRDFPRGSIIFSVILIIVSMFIYLRGGNEFLGFGIVGLVFLLFSLSLYLTIMIDKDTGIMSIKSIWRRQATYIPLNELRDIQVEESEVGNGNAYRLVAIKTDGKIIPFRSWYTPGLSSYKKKAIQLCNFIGLGNDKIHKRRQQKDANDE